MIGAFAKALEQFRDPAVRSVVWRSIAVSIGVFAVLWALVGFLLTHTTFFQIGWLDTAIDVLGGIATLAISWFLFPVVISAFIGLFLERVAEAVERRHYPALPAARDIPLAESIGGAIKFLAVTVSLNLIVLIFLIFPPVFPFVFYGVNGYLLSREYFEVVAARRLPVAAARDLRHRNMPRLFIAGVLVAFLLTVPIVNLLAPILGTAAMVHIFQRLRQRG